MSWLAATVRIWGDDMFAYALAEKETFGDTVSDSSKGWTLDPNAEITDGKWAPKTANVPGGADWVTSFMNLPASVRLSNGPVAIYFSMSTLAVIWG